RSEYLLGRYAGILAAFGMFLLVSAGIGLLLARAVMPMVVGARTPDFAFRELGIQLAAAFLSALASAAVILMLSTVVPGYGAVLGFILLTGILAALPGLAAQVFRSPALQKFADLVRENLLPPLDWVSVLHGQDPLGPATGRWVLALVLYLAAALALF